MSALEAYLDRPFELPRPHRAVIGGRYKSTPEDFIVEEISLYDPDGRPGHLHIWVEKVGVSTPELVRILAERLSVPAKHIGTAGLKDARALTRQWVSVPMRVEQSIPRADSEHIKVLRVERSSSKLRTGELAGNRFRIVLRETTGGVDVIDGFLNESGGVLPAYFGHQRFGAKGDTHRLGFDLLRGKRCKLAPRMLRLALSAAQSALFNALLAWRVDQEIWRNAVEGDVLLRPGGGVWLGVPQEASAAVEARQAIVTGPIFGPHMRPASGVARSYEQRVLEAAKLADTDFDRFGKLTAGTRRGLWMRPKEVSAIAIPQGIELRFELGPGQYATEVLDALGVTRA